MKKMFFLLTALCFAVSACTVFATPQPQAAAPAPLSDADIQATVAFQVEQTLQSLPTPTTVPSNTPLAVTATNTSTQAPTITATETQNSALLTLTATLGTGTIAAGTTPSSTSSPASTANTPQYQYYGTMPPNLPFGKITLLNMSKADVYISLQCTTPDGYTTIIEYPLGGSRVKVNAPAGRYIYVAWVGGQQFTGKFKLDRLQDLKITIYKDQIKIK